MLDHSVYTNSGYCSLFRPGIPNHLGGPWNFKKVPQDSGSLSSTNDKYVSKFFLIVNYYIINYLVDIFCLFNNMQNQLQEEKRESF